MSPLQYQKWIRLNEAKRLMLNENLDAATAGFKVGYESPSQFSREYGRQFGTPPKRDIADLRRGASIDCPFTYSCRASGETRQRFLASLVAGAHRRACLLLFSP